MLRWENDHHWNHAQPFQTTGPAKHRFWQNAKWLQNKILIIAENQHGIGMSISNQKFTKTQKLLLQTEKKQTTPTGKYKTGLRIEVSLLIENPAKQ